MARKQYDMKFKQMDCGAKSEWPDYSFTFPRIWHNRVYDLQVEEIIDTYGASRRFNDESY